MNADSMRKKVLRRLCCVAVGWEKQSGIVAYEENNIVQQLLNTTFKMSLLCSIQTDDIAKRRRNDIGLKDLYFSPNICICWMIIQVFKLQFSSTIYSLRMLIQNERKNKNFRKRILKKKTIQGYVAPNYSII